MSYFKTFEQFLFESKLTEKDLVTLGEEFMKNYQIDFNDDNGGFGQCINVSNDFIDWMKNKDPKQLDNFTILQGSPKEKSETAFHAAVLYKPTLIVLDLTYGQFGTGERIKTYGESEFKKRYPLPRVRNGKVIESLRDGSFYRNTSPEFLIELLEKGKVKSKGKNFISISEDSKSGGQDNYGDIQIEFNSDIIMKQGGIYVDYEDPDFWIEYPEIAKHVTGFRNAKEYYRNRGYDGPEEANANSDFTWEQNCENYAEEREIVIPQIKLVPGLIRNITVTKGNINNKLRELLNKNKITY